MTLSTELREVMALEDAAKLARRTVPYKPEYEIIEQFERASAAFLRKRGAEILHGMEDSERLDWLQARGHDIVPNLIWDAYYPTAQGTLRDAIDSARAEVKP